MLLMRKLILLMTGLGSALVAMSQTGSLVSYGQQDPQFSQYALSPAMFNPAATGVGEAWVSSLLIRSQWVGLPGAPVSQDLTSHVPVYKLNSGAGIHVTNITAGEQRLTTASAAWSYHKRFGGATLSAGLSGGILQYSLNGDKLITPTGTYGDVVDHNDPNLPVTLMTKVIPDAAAGIYFFTDDLQVGVSANHVLLPLWADNAPADATVQYNPNAYVYVAYGFDAGLRFRIMPNVLYKTDLNAGVVDVNTLVTYDNRLMAGISARAGVQGTFDAISLMAGVHVADKWQISYAYDITLSELNTVSSGSHEIGIRYRIPVARPRAGKMINNPRFLYH